jgi:hypothetical protein
MKIILPIILFILIITGYVWLANFKMKIEEVVERSCNDVIVEIEYLSKYCEE